MNANLVMMVALALLLLGDKATSWAWTRWVSWGVAALLLIQPAVAVLKWVGGYFGV